MTLDVAVVCPDCRRFYHGPPGRLPFGHDRAGAICPSPRHNGERPEPSTLSVVEGLLEEAMRNANPNAIEVRVDWLTDADLERVERVAQAFEKLGLPNMDGCDLDAYGSLANRIPAFQLELAVATFTSLPWRTPFLRFRDPDVGEDIEVKRRQARFPSYWLDNRRRFRTDRRYVIGRGQWPDLYVHGWIHGRDAQRFEFVTMNPSRPKVLDVPAAEFHPLETLRD